MMRRYGFYIVAAALVLFIFSMITMTKIFYENGVREYTVKIHHKRMENLSTKEQEVLLEELSMTNFTDKECKIRLTFI